MKALCRIIVERWCARHNITRVLVVGDSMGRLANRLTRLANLIGFAQETNSAVVDLGLKTGFRQLEHSNFGRFVYPVPQSVPEKISAFFLWWALRGLAFPCSPGKPFPGGERLTGDWQAIFTQAERQPLKVGQIENWEIQRWFYFVGLFFDFEPGVEPQRPAVKDILKFSRQLNLGAREALHKFRVDNRRFVVGVHLRQGDYRVWREGRFFFEVEQYCQAMKKIRDEMAMGSRKVAFFVCSDEQQNTGSFSGLEVKISQATPQQDLCILSHCDLILSTHSSFAFWASFLGQVKIRRIEGLIDDCKSSRVAYDGNVVDWPLLKVD